MGFSDWVESTFSVEKFNAQKALRYARKEYQESVAESNFNAIFLELAKEEIEQQGRLLSVEEVERIVHKARIQARHRGRNSTQETTKTTTEEELLAQDSTPRTTGTLSKEIYSRLDKQLQMIKTTTNPFLTEGELGIIRNLKLKTVQENIQKIVQELAIKAKAHRVSPETEKALHLEIKRWSELAQKINGRLEKKVTSLEFKDYVNSFDKSFQQTKSQAEK